MSDPLIADVPRPAGLARSDEKTMPMVIYGLYLLGFLTGFVSTVVGVIMAYALRAEAGPMAFSHYTFLIRTFWIALAASVVAGTVLVVGGVLSLILVGIPFVIAAGFAFALIPIWFAVRCIVGLIRAAADERYASPRAWLL